MTEVDQVKDFTAPQHPREYYVMNFNESYESSSTVSTASNEERTNVRHNSHSHTLYHHLRALYLISAVVVIAIMFLCVTAALIYCKQYISIKTSLSTVAKTTSNLNSTVTTLHYSTLGLSPGNPAESCAKILYHVPQSPSGYYWLRLTNGPATKEYCEMTRECGGTKGGWMRVANFDILQEDSTCPEGSHLITGYGNNKIGCVMDHFEGGCISSWFDTHGLKSTKICGSAFSYQFGQLNGFNIGNSSLRSVNPPLDSNYVDGISFTYGHHPRKHIWTLAAGGCPCSRNRPGFLKDDFYCGRWRCKSNCLADPKLWIGFGICHSQQPDYFFKNLSEPATLIEMRMCRDEDRNDEDLALNAIQLYVQ